MSEFVSCLYFGEVVHQRHSPRRHRLRYRVFQGLFDLDELPSLDRKLRFFSHNRANVFAFHDSDHGEGAVGTLRAHIEGLLAEAGLSTGGGRITVLCMPRILGFVFNPLSIYYCYDRSGELTALVHEVNNTFGQRHSYLIPVDTTKQDQIWQTCKKAFYVSPFLAMDMTYEFKLTLPGQTLTTCINGADAEGAPLIFAAFTGARRDLSDVALSTALVMYPLLTLGVVVAIHWEAAKLFAKGLRLRRRPSPPAAAVTIVEPLRSDTVAHLHKMDKQTA